VEVPDYDLPEEMIAQAPAEPRDAARLLDALGDEPMHRTVADLPALVGPGDVVVVNDSRVIPARLRLQKPTGGRAEILLLEPAPGAGRGERMYAGGGAPAPTGAEAGTAPGTEAGTPPGTDVAADSVWVALVRPGRRLPPGTRLIPPGGCDALVEVGDRLADGRRRVHFLAPPGEVMARYGSLALPPYIRAPLVEPERYQTVYARRPGSVAAPTAGLHLTPAVLEGIEAAGAQLARVELAVGLDTFAPVKTARAEDHPMHSERYRVPDDTWAACASARRVWAIGTTTVRALETAALSGEREGASRLFIRPGFRFSVVDVLLTNFHLPRSTLLLLLEAFCGPRWRDLYRLALAEGYRFLSFGDAMVVGRR
jgi:S-adenosylmethionine:tRNA ribosyltransferase-isomerase